MDNRDKDSVGTGLKIALVAVVLLVVLMVGGVVLLPMLQTVGGSFGYGFPGGSGGRAIREVEIDVDPQVVYRIDDHRFFSFEKYISCTSGGFVYYNDTNKKIKVLVGGDGGEGVQNEVTISEENDIMAFKGRFVYNANDDVIAYPVRVRDHKYGLESYYITYRYINGSSTYKGVQIYKSSNSVIVSDGDIYIQNSSLDKGYEKHDVKNNSDDYEWVFFNDMNIDKKSVDDQFYCNNDIKPRSIKFISD